MSQPVLNSLNEAESALRENLHRSDLDPTARAHMERALNHVREAYIATNEIGKARTVPQLVNECETLGRLMLKIQRTGMSRVATLKPAIAHV